jgi:hypothetical protein
MLYTSGPILIKFYLVQIFLCLYLHLEMEYTAYKLFSPQRRRDRRGNNYSIAAEKAAIEKLQPLRGVNSFLSVHILV